MQLETFYFGGHTRIPHTDHAVRGVLPRRAHTNTTHRPCSKSRFTLGGTHEDCTQIIQHEKVYLGEHTGGGGSQSFRMDTDSPSPCTWPGVHSVACGIRTALTLRQERVGYVAAVFTSFHSTSRRTQALPGLIINTQNNKKNNTL